jgi:hypothetical protein
MTIEVCVCRWLVVCSGLTSWRCCSLQGVIAVEGLDLRHVDAGWYELMCLPAKLGGSDGAPVRCVLHSQQLPGSASGARQDAVQVGEGTATAAAASGTGAAGAAVEPPAVVQPPAVH